MDINSLTIGEVKELKAMFGGACAPTDHPFIIGKAYLVRCVTHYYIGVLKSVYNTEMVFTSASWIPDTGRYSDALKTGQLSEIEPIPTELIIGRGAIVDLVEWQHTPPKDKK